MSELAPDIQFDQAELLTLHEADKAQTECGVIGIYSPNEGPLALALYNGAVALQDRGQLAAGIVVNQGDGFYSMRGQGRVKAALGHLMSNVPDASIGVAHTRYATSNNEDMPEDTLRRATMPIEKSAGEHKLALAGNMNLKFAAKVAAEHGYNYADFASDGDFLAQFILDRTVELDDDEKAVVEVLQLFKDDAFSISIMTPYKLMAIQDPRGIRPFRYALTEDGGMVVSSEQGAISSLGIYDSEEFKPGHMMVMDSNGLREERVFDEEDRKLCVFEFVYFSRPDNIMLDRGVEESRFNMGRALAEVEPVDVDIVSCFPESGRVVSYGYSNKSGVPYRDVFVKNRDAGRTFIQPFQNQRNEEASLSLLPIKRNIKGMRLLMGDDSIVRGTVTKNGVATLRAAGAKEVHLRIGSPMVKWQCFYAVDMRTREEMFANRYKTLERMRKYLDVDSLAYLPIEPMVQAIGEEIGGLVCDACFTGNYPTEVPRHPTEVQIELMRKK